KSIGPKFGSRASEIAGKIKGLSREQIVKLQTDERLVLDGEGHPVAIEPIDARVKIVPCKGFSVSSDGHLKVALDLALDDDLISEGNARELVNKIQNLRKVSGLEVTDRIKLGISTNPETSKALAKFSEYIKSETLAERLVEAENLEFKQEFDLNGAKTFIALERL
ncbi:MAG TPA: isoleucine--tRNA ligase, partial [candidate division Zixibacteria bacterium]|nr:isoleucine--tRNA ligase [candidate division Zixibacteria bacterium]